MARVRLIVLALAACARAEAVPPPALHAPPGWKELPEIAAAVAGAAKQPGAAVAYGEPAMGCYAFAITVRGGKDTPETLAKELGAVHDVTAGSDSLAAAFDKDGYHGKLRAHVLDGTIDATACYWNDREPDACAKACEVVLK
jgi:hypothetical protein